MTPLRTAALFIIVCTPALLAKTDAIPPCRLDHSLTPVVNQVLQWGIADLKKRNVKFSFDQFAINPAAGVPAKTLAVYIVKDAAQSTIDPVSHCIRRVALPVGSPKGIVRTDGDCLPMDLTKCTAAEKAYMQKRFEEVFSLDTGDSNTGYELTGACYMTNLQACLHEDYMDLLQHVGRRDDVSVKGGCIANNDPPATIRCSAGALKMLLSREAAAEKAPTLGILFVLSHELSHLAAAQSSTFDGADHVINLAMSKEQKLQMIRNECDRGETLRRSERAADTQALAVAAARMPEINKRWPKQGSVPWLISQAAHFSTNLVRWNNDWHEGPPITLPAVFSQRPANGGMQVLDDAAMKHIDDKEPPSGKTPAEVHAAASKFLCELVQRKQGHWDVLIQSGTTHGTLAGRLVEILGRLRPKKIADDPVSNLEGYIGKISEFAVRRQATYLRELEGEICTLVEQPLQCP